MWTNGESIPDALFRAIQSVIVEDVKPDQHDDNIIHLLQSPLKEICACRNYQLPIHPQSDAIHSPEDLHECLRPILIGLSLTLRTFIHIFIFNSESYRTSGGLHNNSVQIVSSRPTPDEREIPFRHLADVTDDVFVVMIRDNDHFQLVRTEHLRGQHKTWFERKDLNMDNRLIHAATD